MPEIVWSIPGIINRTPVLNCTQINSALLVHRPANASHRAAIPASTPQPAESIRHLKHKTR